MIKVQEIDEKIEELKKELASVKGTETEVYARIVGYYRSVNNWNKGKREEFNYRKRYTNVDEKPIYTKISPIKEAILETAKEQNFANTEFFQKSDLTYKFFYRNRCPNCPSVKTLLSETSLEVTNINVDTEQGFDEARKYVVKSAPTVIALNKKGEEVNRFLNAQELGKFLNKIDVSK